MGKPGRSLVSTNVGRLANLLPNWAMIGFQVILCSIQFVIVRVDNYSNPPPHLRNAVYPASLERETLLAFGGPFGEQFQLETGKKNQPRLM